MTGTTPMTVRPRPGSNSQRIPQSILFGDSRRTRRRSVNVQFGHVDLHEFGPAIGHNPSVTAGVPITLSDRPLKSFSFDLNDFEQRRMGQRRSTRQLHIPKEIREQMLLAQGFPKWEIVHAIRAARIARTNRKQSNDSRAIAEAVEEASKKLKRLMNGPKPSQQHQGPCPLKLGPTNADLMGQCNPASRLLSCDRTVTDEASASTFFNDDLPWPPVRASSLTETTRKPITRKLSYDSLPKLPTRLSIKEDDSNSSDSDEPAHSYRTSTTLREALALNPRDARSSSHEAPKLPERRISGHDKDNELLSDACRLVEALDAVTAMMQKQDETNQIVLPSPAGTSYRPNKPALPLYLIPSAQDADEEEVDNKETTFWHSYPTGTSTTSADASKAAIQVASRGLIVGNER